MALAAKLELLDKDGRRGSRKRVRLDGSLGGERPTGSDVIVHDLSSSGFMFATDQNLAIGSHVDLNLAGLGKAAARVVWRQGPCCGCEFSRLLDGEEVAAALRAASVVWGNFGSDEARASPPTALEQISVPGLDELSEAEMADGVWPRRDRFLFIGSSAIGLWAAIFFVGAIIAKVAQPM